MKELEATKGVLDQRWKSLTIEIGELLDLDQQSLQVGPDHIMDAVWAGFVGAACERVVRNQGHPIFVAPLCELHSKLLAWLGFSERWEKRPKGSSFSFRELSLTVHFGLLGDPFKPQVFRAEWPGIREWDGTGFGFQSPGAGHPHWQFDLSETLHNAFRDKSPEYQPDEMDKVEDFGALEDEPNVLMLVRSTTLESMHFASAAPWWTTRHAVEHQVHMNPPDDISGLTRWLLACIAYIKQELTRCEFRTS